MPTREILHCALSFFFHGDVTLPEVDVGEGDGPLLGPGAAVEPARGQRAVILFGRVFFLILLGGQASHVRPVWALSTCGEPNEIGLTPIGVKLDGSLRVPFGRVADHDLRVQLGVLEDALHRRHLVLHLGTIPWLRQAGPVCR